MTSLHDREQAIENKFAYDQKVCFETEAKAAKIFGLWVAEQIGLEGADAETYAQAAVTANLEESGFEDLIHKATVDIEAKAIDISDHMLHYQMDEALKKAQQARQNA